MKINDYELTEQEFINAILEQLKHKDNSQTEKQIKSVANAIEEQLAHLEF